MGSAYHTDSEGKKIVFIDPLYDYREGLKLRRLRLAVIVCGCLSFVGLFIVILSTL